MANEPIYGGRFNVYDVFAHFLPGVVILIGLYVPVVMHFANASGDVPGIDLDQMLALVVVAYFLGLVSQAIGSKTNVGDRPFTRWIKANFEYDSYINPTLLEHIGSERDNCETDLDKVFFEAITTYVESLPYDGSIRLLQNDERGNLSATELEEEIDHLFKFVMSYLEASPLSRTMRIHGLYLATRGLYVAFAALAAVYAGLVIGLYFWDGIFAELQMTVLQVSLLLGLSLLLAWVLFLRSKHYEHDVHRYIASEFVINEEMNGNGRTRPRRRWSRSVSNFLNRINQ